MRTISHWYTAEVGGYWDNGQYRRTYVQYPVYEDELTPFELEARRLFGQKRQLDAAALVLDSYIQVEKKRAELERLLAPSRDQYSIR